MGWELRLLWITALGIRGNGFSSSRSMAKGLNYGFVAKVLGEFLLNKDLLFSQTGKRISTPRMSQGCCSSYAFIFEAHLWDYLLQLGPIAQPYSSSHGSSRAHLVTCSCSPCLSISSLVKLETFPVHQTQTTSWVLSLDSSPVLLCLHGT